MLVHHPFESFATTVEAFLESAAKDPNVLAIKLTLYRTSGDTPVVHALINAAGRGKQVVVLVELKARFDEANNIYNSRTARLYTDFGLFTCNPLIGADLSDLFNYLTGLSHQRHYRKLLVAPAACASASSL